MGGLGLMVEQISEYNHEALGADGWEMSAHGMSAPDHEPYQGRQYSDAEWLELNGLPPLPGAPANQPQKQGVLKRRVGTLNCGHTAAPIIIGVNRPQYTPEQLAELSRANEEGVTVDGKHYTKYEAGQHQRGIERRIRRLKRQDMLVAPGDTEQAAITKAKLNKAWREYRQFSKDAGLKTQYERMHVSGWSAKSATASSRNFLQSGPERGIIQAGSEENMSVRSANGMRKSPFNILSDKEIGQLKNEIQSISADEKVFSFNTGTRTSYSDTTNQIRVRGDVFPDLQSTHPRDRMSARAVLAHEYYGHYKHSPSKIDIGDWRDEFRASYMAAKNAPNLSDEDRRYLILDAIERATEAGAAIKHNKFMKEVLYGY
jgi:hypothetical protein